MPSGRAEFGKSVLRGNLLHVDSCALGTTYSQCDVARRVGYLMRLWYGVAFKLFLLYLFLSTGLCVPSQSLSSVSFGFGS